MNNGEKILMIIGAITLVLLAAPIYGAIIGAIGFGFNLVVFAVLNLWFGFSAEVVFMGAIGGGGFVFVINTFAFPIIFGGALKK